MDEFVKAATSGRRARADALYDRGGPIRGRGWSRAKGWEGDANAPGGPNGWAPLLYVTHSVYANVDLARDLLARGADPNVTFSNEYGEMSALYGAAGVVHDPAADARAARGGREPGRRRVGLPRHRGRGSGLPARADRARRDARADPPRARARRRAPEHVKLLLEAGVDARELLPYAVRRGRGPEYVQLLFDHGADLEHRAGEDWRKPTRLRTAYQHAQLRNADEVAQLLVELGAETEVDADDLNVAAIARGEDDRGPQHPDYDQQEVLILAALRGQAARVIETYGPDFEGVVGGSPKAPLLHHAAWFGAPAVVDALLAAGADPLAGEWSPLATAVHASGDAHRDHVGVAERLVAAGSVIEPWMLEQADGPLADWLRRHQRGDG